MQLELVQRGGLEVFREVVKALELLEVPFMLDFGSLLGAARHGGFIPWDDDIDISISPDAMRRFCHEGPEILPDHLAIQRNPSLAAALKVADLRYAVKVRSPLSSSGSLTEYLSVDIFPLVAFRKFAKMLPTKTIGHLMTLHPSAGVRATANLRKSPAKALVLRGIQVAPKRGLEAFAGAVARGKGNWLGSGTGAVYGHGLGSGFGPEFFPGEMIFPLKSIAFEEINAWGPNDVDGYLRTLYGDWRNMPPVEDRLPPHFISAWSLLEES